MPRIQFPRDEARSEVFELVLLLLLAAGVVAILLRAARV